MLENQECDFFPSSFPSGKLGVITFKFIFPSPAPCHLTVKIRAPFFLRQWSWSVKPKRVTSEKNCNSNSLAYSAKHKSTSLYPS